MIALLFRIGFLLLFSDINLSNFQYDTIGWNIAQGLGYSMESEPPYIPSAYRPPVYTYLLALIYKIFGHSYLAVKIFQAILGSFTCILTYIIAKKVFNRFTALMSSLLSAVYPAFLLYSNQILMEVTITFLVVLCVYLFIGAIEQQSVRSQLLFGASIGLASLCKPVMLLFPVFAIIGILFIYSDRRTAFLHNGIMLSAFLIILTPWTIRNYIVFDELLPVVAKGMGSEIWQGKYLVDEELDDFDMEIRGRVYEMKDSLTVGLDLIEAEKKLFRLGIEYIIDHPLEFTNTMGRKMVKLWKHPIGATRTLPKYSVMLAELFIFLYYIMLIFAIIGIYLSKKYLHLALPMIIIIIYFTLLHGFLHAINRYRVPVLPFIIIFSSFAFTALQPHVLKKLKNVFKLVK